MNSTQGWGKHSSHSGHSLTRNFADYKLYSPLKIVGELSDLYSKEGFAMFVYNMAQLPD